MKKYNLASLLLLIIFNCTNFNGSHFDASQKSNLLNPKQLNQPKINFEHDEFADKSSLKLVDLPVKDIDGRSALLNFYIVNKGKTLIAPSLITIHFVQESDDWKFLNFTQTYFLIDKERFDLGSPEHRGSVHSGGVLEQLFYIKPFSFFEKMANSKSVKFKIGTSIFNIDQEGLNHIITYYKKIIELTSEN